MRYRILIVVLALAMIYIARAGAETITVTTYNIEHFADHFEGRRLTTRKVAKESDDAKEMVAFIKKANDEDNWEVAETMLDPKVNADIIVMQECCGQADLEWFNHHWLKDAYEKVTVFPTNTERDQNVAMMIKPGFKVLETKDDYYKELDPVKKHIVIKRKGEPDVIDDSPMLFARGPAFVKIQSPGGYVFWVGTNHMKSKFGNSGDVTAWRNREAVRIHQIMVELSKAGPSDMIYLGDCNDENGLDGEFEKDNGGDTIANLLGPESDGFVLETKPLLARGEISFGGYSRPEHRSFIDHVFASPTMAKNVKGVSVFHDHLADVASDHYPVTVKIEAPKTQPSAAGKNVMP
jgi:endonuclease/exonuclease/phosphatase family metal-dependent hydrolase